MKWRPCMFKACGRTEHVGRARWDAKRSGWQVREMRPGFAPAPSLYGPSAVYSITWLSRADRDRQLLEAAREHKDNERRREAQRLLNAICEAIGEGAERKGTVVDAAMKATGATMKAVLASWKEAVDRGVIERDNGRWMVSDDIPF